MKNSPKALMAAPANFDPNEKIAAYVAWLLEASPHEVYPHGPEHTAEAHLHLVDWLSGRLRQLVNQAREEKTSDPEFLAYLEMLEHCDAVMSGKSSPAVNDWYSNVARYRRGIYLSHSSHLGREPRA